MITFDPSFCFSKSEYYFPSKVPFFFGVKKSLVMHFRSSFWLDLLTLKLYAWRKISLQT